MKTYLLCLVVLIALVFGGCGTKSAVKSGQTAPDITGTTPDGKTLSLSSLHGKLVLLDFWASWCKPCRAANPDIVKIYNKYKDKKFKDADGFTVFSVSLDTDVENWKAAIDKDHLSWPYHVSDLKGWKSQFAAMYGVQAIPTNFMISPDGQIVEHDLMAVDLEHYLGVRAK
jgi:thiol-disulfide isomerase/thioredoxin